MPVCNDPLTRSASSCVPAPVEPCGTHKGFRSRRACRSHICTHSRQISLVRIWKGGRSAMGSSCWQPCADGFGACHVTRISPVVTFTLSLVLSSHAAHMSGMIYYTVMEASEDEGLFALVFWASLTHGSSIWCSFEWMSVWLCLLGLFSWALQKFSVVAGRGKVIFNHTVLT